MKDPREFKDYSDQPTNNGWRDLDWPPPYQHKQRIEDDFDDEDIPLEETEDNWHNEQEIE